MAASQDPGIAPKRIKPKQGSLVRDFDRALRRRLPAEDRDLAICVYDED